MRSNAVFPNLGVRGFAGPSHEAKHWNSEDLLFHAVDMQVPHVASTLTYERPLRGRFLFPDPPG